MIEKNNTCGKYDSNCIVLSKKIIVIKLFLLYILKMKGVFKP